MLDAEYDIIDMNHKILFPMLFNLHAHLGESIFKDINGTDWTITKYLSYTSKLINKQCKEEQEAKWYKSAIYTMREMLNNGTCGFCAARSAPVYKKLHLNTMAGYPIMNTEKLKMFQVGGIEEFDRYYSQYNDEKCSVGIFLHSLYMTDIYSLRFAKACMERGAEFVSVHLSEDYITREKEVQRYEKEPAFVLNDYGLLNEKTILVHCGFISENELNLISEKRACIAICPISNKFLNTEIINPSTLKRYGIRWSICTDGLATGRSLSLQDQMRFFKSLYPEVSNEEIFSAVTMIPATIYGRKNYTGTIEIGIPALFNQIYSDSERIQDVLQSFVLKRHEITTLNFGE